MLQWQKYFFKDWSAMKTDVLIAGSGCSGLYCALWLPRDKKITIIAKSELEKNDKKIEENTENIKTSFLSFIIQI